MTDLKIYWSNLTPTRNAWVDDIEDYLNGLQVFYHCEDFQYQRFENELEIVIPVVQADLSQQEVGNYVRIYQDNIAWYYFVMSYKWTSKNSLRLSLSIDSVNTFVGTHIHFSPKTVIERQHMDRYILDEDNDKKLIKQFDPENEEVPVTQERTRNEIIKQNNSNNNWYLIYDSESVVEAESKPVRCRLIADQALTVYKSSTVGPAQTWYSDDIAEGQYYYMDGIDNDLVQLSMTLPWRISGSDTWTGTPLNLGDEMIVDGPSRNINVHGTLVTVYGYWRGIINGFRVSSDSGDVVVALSLTDVQYGESTAIRPNGLHWPGTYATAPDWTTGGLYHGFSFIEVQQLTYYRYSTSSIIPIAYSSYIIPDTDRVTVSIGSLITRTTIPFNQLDRTDSRLVKIINLPYAPCEVTYDEDTGVYTFPDAWVYEDGYMRLTDISLYTEFESSLDEVDWSFLVQDVSSAPAYDDNRIRTKDDPKIETSQFSTYKFLYDSFAQEVKLERFGLTDATQNPTLPIKFKPTNTINSRFAFKFNWDLTVWGSDANIKHGSDYDEYLLVSRNNEETIFSSDYLNYLRNGYNYDKKVKSEQSAMSYLMGGLQVAGAVVSFAASAFTGGASAAAGVALATGAITTFASAGYQQYTNDQAMAQKLKNLQMQSVGVSGSDDVDLLKYYNKNKLYFISYAPLRFQRNALNDLFHYCGYKHKAMGVPNTESRVWFNFIQCKPVFEEEESGEVGVPYNKFWDDIKTRFMAGVTRYHKVNNSYDWAQEKENWEISIVGTGPWTAYNINDLVGLTFTVTAGEYYETLEMYGTWTGLPINGTTQYIKSEFFETEADWDDQEPNETDNLVPNAVGWVTNEIHHQGAYCVRLTVVDTEQPQRNSSPLVVYDGLNSDE